MKKLLLLSSLFLLVHISYSQTVASTQKVNGNYYILNGNPVDTTTTTAITIFAIATPKKDTLFLAKNELGDLTYRIWKEDPKYKGTNPVIIRIDNIAYYENKYSYVANDKKLRN